MTRSALQCFGVAAVAAVACVGARTAGAQQPNRIAFAAHAIPRGTVLAADDIEFRSATTAAATGRTEVSPGWVTRRMIAAGEVLRSPAVIAPQVVTANESVQVEWIDGNVRLTMRSVATRNAGVGDRVTVRTDSGKRMDALVIGPGRVRID